MNKYAEIDDLIVRFKAGDRVAGELLVISFRPLVLSTMGKVYVAAEDQEDAFQDGICAFLEGLGRFDVSHGAGFNGFIKTHLRQFYFKRQGGQFEHSVSASEHLDMLIPGGEGMTLMDAVPDDGVCIEADYEEKDLNNRLWRCVEGLSEKQARVIVAYFREGKTLVEIGSEMGITHRAVRLLRERGIKNLRNIL
ncbi:MAG: sigma-70 family RNA polymerase sigma factor [Eubacterium sp.]